MKEMQSKLQYIFRQNKCMHTRTKTRRHTQTDDIRPPVLRFSQASSLFCGGKHQGAQREEQTNNKQTHSWNTVWTVNKRVSVVRVYVRAWSWHHSKLQAPGTRGSEEVQFATWCTTTCPFHIINLPTARGIQMSAVSLFHWSAFRNAKDVSNWQPHNPKGSLGEMLVSCEACLMWYPQRASQHLFVALQVLVGA